MGKSRKSNPISLSSIAEALPSTETFVRKSKTFAEDNDRIREATDASLDLIDALDQYARAVAATQQRLRDTFTLLARVRYSQVPLNVMKCSKSAFSLQSASASASLTHTVMQKRSDTVRVGDDASGTLKVERVEEVTLRQGSPLSAAMVAFDRLLDDCVEWANASIAVQHSMQKVTTTRRQIVENDSGAEE